MRVLDLYSGLGGRIYAFEKRGLKLFFTVDNDVNCEINGIMDGKRKILNCNLLEVDLDACRMPK